MKGWNLGVKKSQKRVLSEERATFLRNGFLGKTKSDLIFLWCEHVCMSLLCDTLCPSLIWYESSLQAVAPCSWTSQPPDLCGTNLCSSWIIQYCAFSMSVLQRKKGYTLLITTHRGRDPGRAPLQCQKDHPTVSCHQVTHKYSWKIRHRWRAGLSDQIAPSLSPPDAPKHTGSSSVTIQAPQASVYVSVKSGQEQNIPTE